MSLLLNRAQVQTATTGTGTVDLDAAVSPYQSWATAGAVDGEYYSYLIEEGVDWEIGTGVYDATNDRLSRPGPNYDACFASSTGSLLNLAGAATVGCVAGEWDINKRGFRARQSTDITGVTFPFTVPFESCAINGPGNTGINKIWLGPNVNFTAATTDIVTATGHGLVTGNGPFMLKTTGTLPAGLSATPTKYWAEVIDANTLYLATSKANALAGTHVDITSTGAGTHTMRLGEGIIVPPDVSWGHIYGQMQFEALATAGSVRVDITFDDATSNPIGFSGRQGTTGATNNWAALNSAHWPLTPGSIIGLRGSVSMAGQDVIGDTTFEATWLR